MGPLGILGGGQLGRMTLQAASALGLDTVVAECFANSPAARLTSQSVVFDSGWDDPAALARLAQLARVVTLENEFVDWHVLEALEERGARVLPSPACVGVVEGFRGLAQNWRTASTLALRRFSLRVLHQL